MNNERIVTITFLLVITFFITVFSYGLTQVQAVNITPIASTQSGTTTKPEEDKEVYVEPDPIKVEPLYKAVEVTCIYNDGYKITKSYDPSSGSIYAKISDYTVVVTEPYQQKVNDYGLLDTYVRQPSVSFQNYNWCKCSSESECYSKNTLNSTGTKKLNSCPIGQDFKNQLVAYAQLYGCRDTYRRWITVTKDGDVSTTKATYFYQWDYGPAGTDGKGYFHVYDILERDKNTQVLYAGTEVKLVAERIEFVENVYENAITLVNKSTQATGQDEYISMGYYNGMDVWYLNKDGAITSLYLSEEEKQTLKTIMELEISGEKYCINFSEREQSASEGSFEYIFSQPRHKLVGEATCVANCTDPGSIENYNYEDDIFRCTNGGKMYEIVGFSKGVQGPTDDGNDVCEKIPRTVMVLSKVMKILQIIVPVLVLIYTCIDIGRIVVAGNLEEELPKRKKSIIIRIIVMIAFFFLPFIVRVVFNTVYGEDVGSIECIYDE